MAQGVGKRSLKCGRLKLASLTPGNPDVTRNCMEKLGTEEPRGPVGRPGAGIPKLLDIQIPLGLEELGTESGPWAEEPKAGGMWTSILSHRRLCLA